MAKDLRYAHTEERLANAFAKLLKEKPLAKMSVTELCRLAEVNKGTFYLHYPDIFALAEAYSMQAARAFVESMDYAEDIVLRPEKFADGLCGDLEESRAIIEVFEGNGMLDFYVEGICTTLRARLTSTFGDIEDTRIPMALTFIVSGTITLYTHFDGDGSVVRDVLKGFMGNKR